MTTQLAPPPHAPDAEQQGDREEHDGGDDEKPCGLVCDADQGRDGVGRALSPEGGANIRMVI